MSDVARGTEHPAGFVLDVPREWEVVHDPTADVALWALAPEVQGFRPNVVVTVGPSAQQPPAAWQPAAVEGLREKLEDLQLLDTAYRADGFRQLLAYVQQGRALTLEQWAWRWQRADGTARDVTLSATVPTLAYDEYADAFADVAASWRLVAESDAGIAGAQSHERADTP